jgi:hypothetical protein
MFRTCFFVMPVLSERHLALSGRDGVFPESEWSCANAASKAATFASREDTEASSCEIRFAVSSVFGSAYERLAQEQPATSAATSNDGLTLVDFISHLSCQRSFSIA